MRNIYTLVLAICASLSALGQEIVVRGTVFDKTSNDALPGVNIILKDTNVGVVTDVDGRFTINAPSDGTLVVSFVGYKTEEIPIQGRSQVSVNLEEDLVNLKEVVVSAFGIKREAKKLGYSFQDVDSEALERVADPNIGSALRGKFAGVNINSNAGGVGSSVGINIRGISSLGPNNQPLIVLDGVVIDGNQGGQGDFAEGVDYGNTLSNLNPNDVESIAVLKGGNATALYGSLGINGVLVITTKKGKSDKATIDINSAITFGSILVAPKFQNEYGQGRFDTGTGELLYDISQGSSYGPRLDGTQRERFDGVGTAPFSAIGDDGFKDFFRTSTSLLNSVAISQGNDKFDYRISYSRADNQSIIPGSKLTRQNFSVKTGAQVLKWLRVNGKLDYINQVGENRPELTGGQSNIVRALSLRPRNIPNSLLRANATNANGTPNNWEGQFITNPFYTVNTLLNQDQTDRYIGLLELEIDITKELKAKLNASQDLITSNQEIFNPLGAFTIAADGRYITTTSNASTKNFNFLLLYNKVLSNQFDLSVTAGVSRIRSSSEALRSTGTTFLVPNFFSLNNFDNFSREPFAREFLQNSAFGTVTLGYNQVLFLELTGRNDWNSTLPIEDASFFYPSVGLSFLATEAIPGLKNSGVLSNLKLRGSFAQTGGATDPFSLINTFRTSSNVFNGQRFFFLGLQEEGAGLGPQLANPNLVAEISSTLEFGIDASFLNNRINLNATYFNIRTDDQILRLTLPTSSGAANQLINAGLVTNKGLEISLSADIIKTKDFTWTSSVNFTNPLNEVEELALGVPRNTLVRQFNDVIQIAAEVGSSARGLFGSTFQRNDEGQILYDSQGLPIAGEIAQIGDALPDALVNWNNTLTYKQFSLGFLLDARFGGDLFSFSEFQRHTSGTAIETLEGREFYEGGQGIPVPNDAVFADGEVLNDNVAQRGNAPDVYFGRLSQISENWILDGSFIKLREISVQYRFPKSIVEKLGLSNLSIAYVGRNLAILHRNTENFDPETGFNTSFSGVEFFGLPTARTQGIKVNLTF